MSRVAKALLVAFLALPLPGFAEIVIDDFSRLDDWRELEFRGIERRSSYDAFEDGEYLRVRADSSASMLVLDEAIDVYETPILRWRWLVKQPLDGADLQKREGDDAPIRLYVAFRVPTDELPLARRLWARTQKRLYGAVPPDSALSFVWSGKEYDVPAFRSPYTERQFLVVPDPLVGGRREIDTWLEYRANLLDTYRRLFGSEPPGEAYLAVMGDADNTAGESTAVLDYVRFESDED